MGRRKIYGDDLNPEIKRLYLDFNYSFNQISKELEIHPQVVKRKLKSMGVETRNLSKAMSNYFKNFGDNNGQATV